MPPIRATSLLALLCLPSMLACKDPGRIDLYLRASDDLDLSAIAEVEVRLLAEATGRELTRSTVAGTNLAELPRLFARTAIDPGTAYVFEVRADTEPAICASGRAVGRSLPVSVGSDTSRSEATVFVACADGITPTGRLRAERALHAAIWAPVQGGALMVGGASVLSYADATAVPLASVELYDIASGQFASTPELLDARILPGVALDAEGRVVVLGGGTARFFDPEQWLDSVEEIDGTARRPKGPIDGGWLGPLTVSLPDGSLALLGIGLHRTPPTLYQASFYDPGTEQIPRDALEKNPANQIVVPIPGQARALLAGGDGGPGESLRPSLFCGAGDCGCGDAPCLVDLADEDAPPSWGPGAGWNDAAGAYLPCPSGGGTAWIVGGKIQDPDAPAQELSVGDVYCYASTPTPSLDLVHVGTLRARNAHGVVAVRGDRLLVVGGFENEAVGGNLVPRGIPEAELVRVSACECEGIEPGDVTDVVVDETLGELGHLLLARASVLLGDGTVLITGNTAIVGTNVEAGSDAWVFNPDLPEE